MDEKWIEDVQKNHVKDFGPPSTKNRTWEPNLEWQVLLTILGEKQLKISCARKPILCSVSQTCFDWQARCFVTCQLLILSSPKSKNWEFLPGTSVLQLFGYPGVFQKVILCSGPLLYIYNNNYYPTYLMSSQPYRFADRLEDVERGWEMLEASPFLVGYSPPQHRRHSAPVPPTSSCGARRRPTSSGVLPSDLPVPVWCSWFMKMLQHENRCVYNYIYMFLIFTNIIMIFIFEPYTCTISKVNFQIAQKRGF